jgi:uncharacterized membrane protein HdeD (DUF308 family)
MRRTSRVGSTPAPEPRRARTGQRYWWMMFQGLCALAFGILALFWPKLTLFLFLYVFGVYAIIDGLGPLGSAIFGGRRAQIRGRPILFLEGIVSIVAGVLCLVLPRTNNRLLLSLVAFWLLLKGISFLLQIRRRGLLLGFVGVLAILAGLSILLSPNLSVHLILLLVGLFAVLMGIVLILRAWRARAARQGAVSPAG